jgi:hypothetical protein
MSVKQYTLLTRFKLILLINMSTLLSYSFNFEDSLLSDNYHSEAWGNMSDTDIRNFERLDELLLSKVFETDANTSNTFKYLELGIYPIVFEIMKRKLIFPQYILRQDKKSMMYKVIKATCENPLKKDYVQTCKNTWRF